jgi:hypothetical protein
MYLKMRPKITWSRTTAPTESGTRFDEEVRRSRGNEVNAPIVMRPNIPADKQETFFGPNAFYVDTTSKITIKDIQT